MYCITISMDREMVVLSTLMVEVLVVSYSGEHWREKTLQIDGQLPPTGLHNIHIHSYFICRTFAKVFASK